MIDELIERHDAADRALRAIGPRQQAPDAEAAGIGMRLLQVIDLDHQRQPDLACRRVGPSALAHKPGEVLGLKPPDPRIDCGPRDLHIPANAPFIPAVIIELDDLEPSLVAVGMPVIVPQPQVPLTGDGTRLPERLDSLVVNRHPARNEQDARQLSGVESVVERFEPIKLLSNDIRNPRRRCPDDDLHILREESQYPLLAKAAG
jgi:hypothetical protein